MGKSDIPDNLMGELLGGHKAGVPERQQAVTPEHQKTSKAVRQKDSTPVRKKTSTPEHQPEEGDVLLAGGSAGSPGGDLAGEEDRRGAYV